MYDDETPTPVAPSALESVDDFPSTLTPARTALMLDFDGTLVDLADKPDAVDVSGVNNLLSDLNDALNGRLVLISGRTVADIATVLGVVPCPVYGAHGAELGLDGKTIDLVDVPAVVPDLRDQAQTFCDRHDHVWLEEKRHGFVLHYRQAPDFQGAVEAFLEDLVTSVPGVGLQASKMAVEVKAKGAGKDFAVRDAIGRFDWHDQVPVMIGDDVTDEAGMNAAQIAGGHGIKIGQGDTVAQFRCASPDKLKALLRAWMDQAND